MIFYIILTDPANGWEGGKDKSNAIGSCLFRRKTSKALGNAAGRMTSVLSNKQGSSRERKFKFSASGFQNRVKKNTGLTFSSTANSVILHEQFCDEMKTGWATPSVFLIILISTFYPIKTGNTCNPQIYLEVRISPQSFCIKALPKFLTQAKFLQTTFIINNCIR